jgi:hypothetical protein
MKKNEKGLLALLNESVDSFDQDSFENYADGPAVGPSPNGGMGASGDARLGKSKYNVPFEAQFDMNFRIQYFTVAAGVFTTRSAAYLLANAPVLATKLTAFLFGNSDFASGFAKLRTQYPQVYWSYGTPGIVGRDNITTSFGNLDGTASAQLQNGDMVFPYAAVSGGVNYVALVITRCTQVAYGTLLDALSSDRFIIDMLRYVINDNTQYNQYANNIGIYKQSLFGKFDSDQVSPNSFKVPEQQQSGIIDIPIKKGIDKQIAFASFIDYSAVDVLWSIFVRSVKKLSV